ncbi:MAG TPA: hypothetical protein VF145_04150, partial [Chitinophagaceae bacterium]
IHRKIDFGNNIQTVLYFTGLIGIGGFLLYRFYKIQPPTKRTWMMWGIYTLIAAGLILYYTF